MNDVDQKIEEVRKRDKIFDRIVTIGQLLIFGGFIIYGICLVALDDEQFNKLQDYQKYLNYLPVLLIAVFAVILYSISKNKVIIQPSKLSQPHNFNILEEVEPIKIDLKNDAATGEGSLYKGLAIASAITPLTIGFIVLVVSKQPWELKTTMVITLFLTAGGIFWILNKAGNDLIKRHELSKLSSNQGMIFSRDKIRLSIMAVDVDSGNLMQKNNTPELNLSWSDISKISWLSGRVGKNSRPPYLCLELNSPAFMKGKDIFLNRNHFEDQERKILELMSNFATCPIELDDTV